jgi:formamidopyrimidine-DNA glycosylase
VPELPEVEILCRNLRRWLVGHRVRLEDLDFGLGSRSMDVVGVRRRAKYALVEGATETWVLHLRMTGKVVPTRAEGRTRARFHAPSASYDFKDTRRLGTLDAVASFDDSHLGPEPWPMQRDADWWRERMSPTRSAIKTALMRQDLVAGLGNIAANEILFRAGIAPTARVPDVGRWAELAVEAHAYLTGVVDSEEGDEIHYVNEGGPNPFQVYGRTRCPRCSGPIERSVQQGRSTFACCQCQQ